MDRTRVVSSSITSIGYHDEQRVLEVEFTGGDVYQYTGVPVHIHAALVRADSCGKYFNAHIKDKYPYKQAR